MHPEMKGMIILGNKLKEDWDENGLEAHEEQG
jgi:hypothetical protein